MKIIKYWKLLIVCIGLLCNGCDQGEKPIRLATYTYATNDRIENMTLLSKELEKRLQRKVQMKSYPDVESFLVGIRSNEVDIGLINTLGYLILSSNNEHMFPLANMHIKKDAVDNYKTVLLTPNDGRIIEYSHITEMADQLTMMFVKEGSTSGNLVPRLFLSANNIASPETQFKEVTYGGNHTSTFNKLLQGQADICAIGSNEYYQQIEADTSLRTAIKLLWVSEEIPLGPVLVNKSLSSTDRDLVSNLFLNLHKENVDAFETIRSGWSEAQQSDKFQLISDSYYDSFREVNGNKTSLNEILASFNK